MVARVKNLAIQGYPDLVIYREVCSGCQSVTGSTHDLRQRNQCTVRVANRIDILLLIEGCLPESAFRQKLRIAVQIDEF